MSVHTLSSRYPTRVATIFLIVLVVLAAIASRTSIGYLPESDRGGIAVIVRFDDAFPEEIEQRVTIPVEDALSTIQGVDRVISNISYGESRTYLGVATDAQLDQVSADVAVAAQRVARGFPPRAHRPIIVKSDESTAPVFIAALPADGPSTEDDLRTHFEAVDGVGQVEVSGAPQAEVHLSIHDRVGTSADISVSGLLATLSENQVIGVIDTSGYPPLTVDQRIGSVAEIERIPSSVDGVPLGSYLSSRWANKASESHARVNGEEVVTVYVRPAGDANSVVLCRDLRRVVADFGDGTVVYDYGRLVEEALTEISISIVAGLGLVLFASLLITRRAGVALAFSVPFSVLTAIATVSLVGLTLDITAFAGIVMGIGIAIDSGIVYLDGYNRSNGSVDAAWNGSRNALLVSTATTVAVFLPLIFADRTLVNTQRTLAIAFSSTVAATVLYVWLFLPAFLSLRARRSSATDTVRSASNRRDTTVFERLVLNRRSALLFLTVVLGVSVVSIYRIRTLPWSATALEGDTRVVVAHDFPSGTSLQTVVERSGEIETALVESDTTENVVSQFKNERAEYTVDLDPSVVAGDFESLVDSLQQRVGATTLVITSGSRTDRWIPVLVRGTEHEQTREAAMSISEAISSTMANVGVVHHFKAPPPGHLLTIDTMRLATIGGTPSQVESTVFRHMTEPVVLKLQIDGEERDTRVIRNGNHAITLGSLLEIPVEIGEYESRLGSFSTLRGDPHASTRSRRDFRPAATLSVVVPTADEERAFRRLEMLLRSTELPFGYSAVISQDYYDARERNGEIVIGLSISVVLVFLILLAYFQDLRLATATFVLIPCAMAFPLAFFSLFSSEISSAMLIGMTIIAGIAVNNGVIILDQRESRVYSTATLRSALRKKQKTLLTATLTTVIGVVPVIVQSMRAGSFLAPLTVTISLGSIGAVVATLFALPLFAVREKES